MSDKPHVIIVGGGPVGMVLALSCHKHNIAATVLEKLPERAEDQRAATIHSTSMDLLDDLGITEHILPIGMQAPLYHIRDRQTGEVVAEFNHELLADELKFPFAFQYEQFKLVDSILEYLEGAPDITIRFSCEVTEVGQEADSAWVAIDNEANETERLVGDYVVGCDGAWSIVRETAGIEFEGFTYPEKFVKIGTTYDLFAEIPDIVTRNFISDPVEWVNLFHVQGYGPPGIWRGVFPTRPDESDEECLSEEAIQRRMQGVIGRKEDFPIAYVGLYHVHQRVAASFNAGRLLLAGDAAHVNNPIGGMGMNGGLHDAHNLGEKLADILTQGGDTAQLDRYTRQRRKAQIDGVQASTIANKKLMEMKDPDIRKREFDNLRQISEDTTKHRAYLRRATLLDSLNDANAVQ